MLDDSQLKELCSKMGVPLAKVCFKDELPRKLEYNKAYIINLDNSMDEQGNENEGTHWTCLQIMKYPTGKIEPIFFDPYGADPSVSIVKSVKDTCGKFLPHTKKDIQSLMNNACGWYCCAFLHFINESQFRTKDLYDDVSTFLDMFDDLNVSIDFKKNEYILKHFFQSNDPKLRRAIDIVSPTEHITSEDAKGGLRIPVEINMMK